MLILILNSERTHKEIFKQYRHFVGKKYSKTYMWFCSPYNKLEVKKLSAKINYSDHKKLIKLSIFGDFALLGNYMFDKFVGTAIAGHQ